MTQITPLPGETKDDARLRAQREYQVQAQADKRAFDAFKCKLYTVWGVWKFCPHKECRRRCACVGDADRCFERFWPIVPEDLKVQIRAEITATARDKLPPREAVAYARAERARYLEQEARFAQQKVKAADTVKPPDTVCFVPENRTPRVRSW